MLLMPVSDILPLLKKGITKRTSKTWSQEKRKFRSFPEFERIIFECSVEIFLNMKSYRLVVDNDLIVSKSDDEELKCFSERKQVKEGHVADCITYSLTNIHLVIRLHLKGDTQENNVIQMMVNLPSIVKPSHSVTVSFDRGYGKFDFLQKKQDEL